MSANITPKMHGYYC